MKNLVLLLILFGAVVSCSVHEKQGAGEQTMKEHSGHRYYLRECGRCHQYYPPGDYTADQWQAILNRKRGKVSLTRAQLEELGEYLKLQAKVAERVQ